MTTYQKRPTNSVHRKIYKEYHGSIPVDQHGRSYDIHHIDGNPFNNDITNLIAVSIQEHYDIHYRQEDWSACHLISKRLNLDPSVISELASNAAKKRVENGTHNFQGSDSPIYRRVKSGEQSKMMKEENARRIENNTHHWLGERNAVHERVKNGEQQRIGRECAKKRLEAGTHNFQGPVSYIHQRIKSGEQSADMRRVALNRLKNGNHNFQTSLSNGTHPSQKVRTCDRCGKTGRGSAMLRYHFENCIGIREKPSTPHHSTIEKTCPHCGKIGKGNAMNKWHFNNCRIKIGD